MQIKIPDKIVRFYEPIGDWLNASAYKRVRRIDILIALVGLSVVMYYGYWSGWQGALLAALMFAFWAMVGLWVL